MEYNVITMQTVYTENCYGVTFMFAGIRFSTSYLIKVTDKYGGCLQKNLKFIL